LTSSMALSEFRKCASIQCVGRDQRTRPEDRPSTPKVRSRGRHRHDQSSEGCLRPAKFHGQAVALQPGGRNSRLLQ
jgi:hypothetical protein